LSKMFVKNLSIICPFAQIVRRRRRRRRRRRLVAPRPGGDFAAPGNYPLLAPPIAKYESMHASNVERVRE
jgi:hypothetical protein